MVNISRREFIKKSAMAMMSYSVFGCASNLSAEDYDDKYAHSPNFVTAQRKKCEISKKVLDTVLLQECQNAFPARTCHAWASGVVDSLVQGFSG